MPGCNRVKPAARERPGRRQPGRQSPRGSRGFGRRGDAALWVICAAALGALLTAPDTARAIDEIQVYTSEINAPGEWTLQLHANYAIEGRKEPEFPGGIVPHHAWQGTPELAYGVTDWWELGAYWPYAITNNGEVLNGGVKLRTLFVAPNAKQRQVLLGLNIELGYANPAFSTDRWNAEARPILGYRTGPYEFIVNPIVDFGLDGNDSRGDFAPAARIAYAVNDTWTWGVEHYADLGPIDAGYASDQQAHNTYLILEYSKDPWSVHVGIGHGWPGASDETVFKTIIGFPL